MFKLELLNNWFAGFWFVNYLEITDDGFKENPLLLVFWKFTSKFASIEELLDLSLSKIDDGPLPAKFPDDDESNMCVGGWMLTWGVCKIPRLLTEPLDTVADEEYT